MKDVDNEVSVCMILLLVVHGSLVLVYYLQYTSSLAISLISHRIINSPTKELTWVMGGTELKIKNKLLQSLYPIMEMFQLMRFTYQCCVLFSERGTCS